MCAWIDCLLLYHFCCCCFSFCCRGLFVSFTGTIHWEGSSPSYAAGRRALEESHHHEMLLDNLWTLYTTVRVVPQPAGFCRSWRLDFLAQNYDLLQSNNCLLGCERVMETRVEFHCSWVYNEGFYPDCLKVAKVIPIYKYGEQKVCSNYRPISILLQFNKIFERILYDRVYFIYRNTSYYPNINLVSGLDLQPHMQLRVFTTIYWVMLIMDYIPAPYFLICLKHLTR